MTEAVEPKSKVRTVVELITSTGKDLVAFLRDSILFIFAFLLLLFPVQFNSILTNAGFEEGSFAGLKWKNKVEATTERLDDASTQIARLQGENNKLVATLAEVQQHVDDPALKQKVAEVEQTNKVLSADTTQIQSAVQQTIRTNTQLLDKAYRASDGQFVVIFGGDTKLEDAKYEVQVAASKLGVPNATIQLKQGIYRTVVVASSRDEADGILAKVKVRRPDAYIVSQSKWCPNSVPRDGFSECTSQ